MNEISPEESEAIIDAAADGVTAGAHAPLGEMLTSLHAPADSLGSAPAISMASRNVTGRIARRTAVAASIAVLGLASVAARTSTTSQMMMGQMTTMSRTVRATGAVGATKTATATVTATTTEGPSSRGDQLAAVTAVASASSTDDRLELASV
jgi:hypothetical protein